MSLTSNRKKRNKDHTAKFKGRMEGRREGREGGRGRERGEMRRGERDKVTEGEMDGEGEMRS